LDRARAIVAARVVVAVVVAAAAPRIVISLSPSAVSVWAFVVDKVRPRDNLQAGSTRSKGGKAVKLSFLRR